MSKPSVKITITEAEDPEANPQIHLVALTMFNDFKTDYIDKAEVEALMDSYGDGSDVAGWRD